MAAKEKEIEDNIPRRKRPFANAYRGISSVNRLETVDEPNKLENVKALNTTISNSRSVEDMIEINLQSKERPKESDKALNELQWQLLQGLDEKEEIEEEEEKNKEKSGPFPEFAGEGVDRLTNFITKTMSQEELVEKMLSLMATLHGDTNRFMYGTPKALTYELIHNCFHCRVQLDDFQNCEFTVTMYAYSNNRFLLDIHELFGEHFTFNRFLQDFKSVLQEQDIAKIPKFSKKFYESYGLDIEIGFASLDSLVQN